MTGNLKVTIAAHFTSDLETGTDPGLQTRCWSIEHFPASNRLRVIGILDLDPAKRVRAGLGLTDDSALLFEGVGEGNEVLRLYANKAAARGVDIGNQQKRD